MAFSDEIPVPGLALQSWFSRWSNCDGHWAYSVPITDIGRWQEPGYFRFAFASMSDKALPLRSLKTNVHSCVSWSMNPWI